MNGWSVRNSGNVFLMTSGSANEKPMNDPNVPV
jgi:hypothetical protein